MNKRPRLHLEIRKGDSTKRDLQFWLAKTPEERISAVEFLREQYYVIRGYADLPRLELVIRRVKRDW